LTGLMITCGLATLAAAIFDVKHYFHIQVLLIPVARAFWN